MTNFSRSLTLIFALLALTFVAGANPLINVTLTGIENTIGGVSGPYYFTTSPQLGNNIFTCLTDSITNGVGSTWVAEDFAVVDFSAPVQKQLEEAYSLETRFGLDPTQADWNGIHDALWFIMGTGGSNSGNVADVTTSAFWYHYATTLPTSTLSSYSSQFSVLIPELTAGNTNITVDGLNRGVAQSFLVPGVPGTPGVPEPASMVLLGTGLVGLGLVGRKQRNAKK